MSLSKSVDEVAKTYQTTSLKNQYHYAWVVKDFRDFYSKVGCWHASPKFFTGNDYEWHLKLFAAGYDEATSEHVGIQAYLMKRQTYRKLKLTIECSVLGKNGKKRQSRVTTQITEKVQHKSRITFKRFISKQELLDRPELLPNDELRILCQISFNTFSPVDEIHQVENYQSDDFTKFFDSDKFSDFTFITGNREFKVHRTILAAKSPVFEAMFDSNMPDISESKIYIDDIVPEAMRRLLQFIYIGRTDLKGFAGEILVAAEKYQLRALKQLCENELAMKLNVDNIYRVLQLADEYNATELKMQAMEFFGKHLKKLKDVASFKISVSLLPLNIQTDIICALADNC